LSRAWLFKAQTNPWCWSIYPFTIRKLAQVLDVEPSELVKAG
jgi:hypothetical protein